MLNYWLIAWNVNGYNDEVHQQVGILLKEEPDVLFLSETHQDKSYFDKKLEEFGEKYEVVVNSHNPARWHGVLMMIHKKHKWNVLDVKLEVQSRKETKNDDACCGRVVGVRLNGKVNIIGCYTPNSGFGHSSDKDKINEKYEYRTSGWDNAFYKLLDSFKDDRTVVVGDLNVAPNLIDVSHPSRMQNYSGFTIKERGNFKHLLEKLEYEDAWRMQHPTTKEFTWLGKACGMRLDYTLVSSTLKHSIVSTDILSTTASISDHKPVSIVVTI